MGWGPKDAFVQKVLAPAPDRGRSLKTQPADLADQTGNVFTSLPLDHFPTMNPVEEMDLARCSMESRHELVCVSQNCPQIAYVEARVPFEAKRVISAEFTVVSHDQGMSTTISGLQFSDGFYQVGLTTRLCHSHGSKPELIHAITVLSLEPLRLVGIARQIRISLSRLGQSIASATL